MGKVLIVASVASMIKQFNMENIKILLKKNSDITIATNFNEPGTITLSDSKRLRETLSSNGIKCIQLDFPRGIGNFQRNYKVWKQLKLLAKNQYDLIHVHSPIGGVLTRLAFNSNKTKIIYTAHGFQFYKGGALKDWILFFPIEFLLSFNTTALLTINNEDTSLAEKYFRTKVMQIPGVGINFSEIQNKLNDKGEYNIIRSTINIDKNSKIMISVGELNARKNQHSVITALGKMKNSNLHYVICGIGPDEDKLKNLTEELELENNVHFLGYTNNVPEYLVASDFSVFLSRREGLGLAGLESMAAGLPLISSNLNGIKDYTTDGITGFIVNDPVDVDEIVEAIKKMMDLDHETFSKIAHENQKIAKKYSIESVNIKMNDIYSEFL